MHILKESHVLQSVEELQNSFKEDGYLLLRGFFSTELIGKVRERIIEVLQQEGWGCYEGGEFVALEPVHRINSPSFHKCIACLMEQEIIHDLSQNQPLQKFLSALLGETVFPHPRKMVRITYPYSLNPKD